MEIIQIYEKIHDKKEKIEKLIYITNLTQYLFDNIDKNTILFNNGFYKNECIKSYLDKHFNISACILPSSIFKKIIESLEEYRLMNYNINSNLINNYFNNIINHYK